MHCMHMDVVGSLKQLLFFSVASLFVHVFYEVQYFILIESFVERMSTVDFALPITFVLCWWHLSGNFSGWMNRMVAWYSLYESSAYMCAYCDITDLLHAFPGVCYGLLSGRNETVFTDHAAVPTVWKGNWLEVAQEYVTFSFYLNLMLFLLVLMSWKLLRFNWSMDPN